MKTKKIRFFLFSLFLLLARCGGVPPSSNSDVSPAPPANFRFDTQIPLALGGVMPGWDQLMVENLNPSDQVKLNVEPSDLLQTEEVDATGMSLTYRLTPLRAGIGRLTYSVNGVEQGKVIRVVVPPQEMIQVLIGEARSIIPQEVKVDAEGRVLKTSVSTTAQAIFSVIRNRIALMVSQDAPELFVVDRSDFQSADSAGRYRLVIEAHHNSTYQFSPVAPGDPSNEAYLAGASREGLSGGRLLTYDQAVLTAAGVYADSLPDDTQGSFGYYSPSKTQYENILTGLNSTDLPSDIGTSDGQFPALSPIQIRILQAVSPQSFDADLPSFVFVGSRSPTQDAVIRF
ncbi:MAG: hypothetical protein U1F57_09630 [bacterium]